MGRRCRATIPGQSSGGHRPLGWEHHGQSKCAAGPGTGGERQGTETLICRDKDLISLTWAADVPGQPQPGHRGRVRGNLSLMLQPPATTSKAGPAIPGSVQIPPGVEDDSGAQQAVDTAPKAAPLVNISEHRGHLPTAASPPGPGSVCADGGCRIAAGSG